MQRTCPALLLAASAALTVWLPASAPGTTRVKRVACAGSVTQVDDMYVFRIVSCVLPLLLILAFAVL